MVFDVLINFPKQVIVFDCIHPFLRGFVRVCAEADKYLGLCFRETLVNGKCEGLLACVDIHVESQRQIGKRENGRVRDDLFQGVKRFLAFRIPVHPFLLPLPVKLTVGVAEFVARCCGC